MEHRSNSTFIIGSIVGALLFSGSLYTMEKPNNTYMNQPLSMMHSMNSPIVQMVGMGAALGFVCPAVAGVFGTVVGCGKTDFASAAMKGICGGSLLGMIFYIVSCPLSTGNVSGWVVPKAAKLITASFSLAVGVAATLTSRSS